MTQREALASGVILSSDYEIERVLGAGGFGITYLARDRQLGLKVAIKEYFPASLAVRSAGSTIEAVAQQGDFDFAWGLDRFLLEARTLALMVHPNIARVMRYFQENGTAYMVLEFVEGEEFEMWLRRLGRPPDQDEFDRILDPILRALEAVHAAGITHRDIKPENIYIRAADGSPVLLDFGAAKQDLGQHAHQTASFVSPGYSPPESYDGDSSTQGPWTDIYGLAASLHRALVGVPPQRGKSREAADTYVPLAARVADPEAYRPEFLKAIDNALHVSVSERPQTVADWGQALFDGSPTNSWRPVPPPPPPPAPPMPAWMRLLLLGVGVVVTLLGLHQIYSSFEQQPRIVPQRTAATPQPIPPTTPAVPPAAPQVSPPQRPTVAPPQPPPRIAVAPPVVPAPPPAPPRTATPPSPPSRTQQAAPAVRLADYRNPRFGFALRYPADIVQPGPPPTNGGGRAFESGDGSMTIASFAQFNTDSASSDALRQQAQADNAVYRNARVIRSSADGFVISATANGRQHVYYLLLSCNRQLINVLELNFAVGGSRGNQLAPIADAVLQSFRTGQGEDTPDNCQAQ